MAPIDRAEHRQQRLRGAGVANVQTNFAFNLGGLGLSRPNKQASLPPIRSGRRSKTPVATTPAGPRGSAKRHRGVSIPRSIGNRRSKSKTPARDVVTPQLGKRKRGAKHASGGTTDDETDELSPENDKGRAPQSIEKSRRAATTVSPIREEREGTPDELSFIADIASSARKGAVEPTVTLETTIATDTDAGAAPTDTPTRTETASNKRKKTPDVRIRKSLVETAPATPVTLSHRQKPKPKTVQEEEVADNEDELSTPKVDAPSVRRSKTKSPRPLPLDDGEIDELSPAANKGTSVEPSPEKKAELRSLANAAMQEIEQVGPQPRKPGRPRKTPESLENNAEPTPPSKVTQPAAPVPTNETVDVDHDDDEEDVVQTTPAQNQPRRSKSLAVEDLEQTFEDEEMVDELSFDGDQTRGNHASTLGSQKTKPVPAVEEVPDENEETFEEEEDETELPSALSPATRPRSPPKKKVRGKSQIDKPPPKKRQKRGPTQIIQVMHLKGFTTKALTVVDTTRTIMEEWTTRRINRIMEKIPRAADRETSRALRRRLHLIVEYREQLDDVLLDLQDANNTAAANTIKLRQLNKEGKQLRNDYLEIQRNRDQIALQFDEANDEYLQEKQEVEAREELSSSLYDIQAAIQSGKEKARKEGREDEGPQLPIKMLIENVATGFGATTGLWGRVSSFNGVLDKAAQVLEGRV